MTTIDPTSLRVFGVSRMFDNPKVALVSFDREPTDDELRQLHRTLDPPLPHAGVSVKKFKPGDRVQKKSGSEWHGVVVGEYSTILTPEGYAVESEREPNSVQNYPAAALEAALSRSPAPSEAVEAVAVKPLDWQAWPTISGAKAPSILGDYEVFQSVYDENQWLWRSQVGGWASSECRLESDAKAAAQADYETRIRSALVTPPLDVRAAAIEECAKVAEGFIGGTDYDLEPEAAVAENVAAKMIAAAIRNLHSERIERQGFGINTSDLGNGEASACRNELEALGLVLIERISPSHFRYRITDAGRAALASIKENTPDPQ